MTTKAPTITKKEYIKHLIICESSEYTCDADSSNSHAVHVFHRFGVDNDLNLYCSNCVDDMLKNPHNYDDVDLVVIDRRAGFQIAVISKVIKIDLPMSLNSNARQISEICGGE